MTIPKHLMIKDKLHNKKRTEKPVPEPKEWEEVTENIVNHEIIIMKHHLEIAQRIAEYYAGRKKLKVGESIDEPVLDLIAHNIGVLIDQTQEWLYGRRHDNANETV